MFYFISSGAVFFLLFIINIIYKREFDLAQKRLEGKNKKLRNLVKRLEDEIRERKIKEKKLEEALDQVQTLSGLLPICASCKSIRDDKGYWKKIETYIEYNTDAVFTHGLCPTCAEELYPGYYKEKNKRPFKYHL